MVKRIDSQALGLVNRSLGVTGSGAQVTELNDGVVDQMLSVGEIVRRSRVLGLSGIFNGLIRNVHAGSDTITTVVEPYRIDAAAPVAPYPTPIPPGFDLWLLYAGLRVQSGTQTNSTATLSVRFAGNQGFGIDNGGGQILGSAALRVAFWDAFATVGTQFGLLNGARGPVAKIGLRLPVSRFTEIIFSSTNGAAAVGLECQLELGMFPTALGQDGIV